MKKTKILIITILILAVLNVSLVGAVLWLYDGKSKLQQEIAVFDRQVEDLNRIAFSNQNDFNDLASFNAYVTNLLAQTKARPAAYVFFSVGMDSEIIDELKAKWEKYDGVWLVNYVDEEYAYDLFRREMPSIEDVGSGRLPSSLELVLDKFNERDILRKIKADVEEENEKLKSVDTDGSVTYKFGGKDKPITYKESMY